MIGNRLKTGLAVVLLKFGLKNGNLSIFEVNQSYIPQKKLISYRIQIHNDKAWLVLKGID